MRLDELPDDVRDCAEQLAKGQKEKLIGWKAITKSPYDNPHVVEPIAYMVITNKGYYEVGLDGIPTRAAVLHPF